jgi:hypothetical protein
MRIVAEELISSLKGSRHEGQEAGFAAGFCPKKAGTFGSLIVCVFKL